MGGKVCSGTLTQKQLSISCSWRWRGNGKSMDEDKSMMANSRRALGFMVKVIVS